MPAQPDVSATSGRTISARPAPDWPAVQLHIVTGKGGTGKTTVAAALALGLAARGKTVLLCEVEGRQGIAQIFDVPPLPYEERLVAPGTTGVGDVYALAIDAESALLEYLDMYYRLGRAGKALDRFGVIEFATTIAPGVRDVLLTGKVYEAPSATGATRAPGTTTRSCWTPRPPDGSPSSSTSTTSWPAWPRWARSSRQADIVMTLLPLPPYGDPPGHRARGDAGRRRPVDGIAELREGGLPIGGVVVNMVRPQDLDTEERAAADRRHRRPRRAGGQPGEGRDLRPATSWSRPLLEEGRHHAERRNLEDSQRALVEALDVADVRAARSCRAASTWPGSTSSPRSLSAEGLGMNAREATTHQSTRASARIGPLVATHDPQLILDVDALLDDREPQHHRVLRLRRRRQDHDVSSAGPARGRARPQGRGAHHRPGAPAGPVDGHRGPRQHPAAGARGLGDRRRQGWLASTR